jgi:hypothetical protein
MATLSPNALEAYCWPELPVDYIRERDEPASPTGIQRIIAALSHHGELKRPAYQRAFIGRLDALTDSGAFNEGFNGEAARAAYEFFSQELAMAKARVAPPAPAARELDTPKPNSSTPLTTRPHCVRVPIARTFWSPMLRDSKAPSGASPTGCPGGLSNGS